MSHDDFQFEPQPGLPAPLPEGEQLLWQGKPNWTALAIRAYHARKVAGYFAVLIAWRIGSGVIEGQPAAVLALNCGGLLLMAAAAVGILCALAYLSSRAAVYSITSRRILLRQGVAVPLTLNIPFNVIASADLRLFKGGNGDIVLRLFGDQRVGYLITWPFLRPGRFARPQPNLRAVDNAAAAAEILGAALARSTGSARIERGTPPAEGPILSPRPSPTVRAA